MTRDNPQKIMVDEATAAEMLSIGERTLQDLRTKGNGPKHRKVGTRVVYSVDALREWANQ